MRPELVANWSRLSPLLDEALDLEPAARAAWLAALPDGHADLKGMLSELLADRTATPDGPVLATLPRYAIAADAPETATAHQAGQCIAGYRLVREIGRGGMGTVWLAEPAAAAAKFPVALKLPRVEVAMPHVRERFERERAILAALNHPRIARLHDAGVTDEGQPYLAIEYVEGGTILEHCSLHAPAVRQRVSLFVQVLEAVQYAHANLVVHRDLKPSNILVTATGDVKLLDFGIAKLIDRESSSTVDTGITQRAGRVMTPDYASPEQVAGLPLTTASDVYSLGVVLFELLTGARPYRLKRGSRAELEEAILAAHTSRPSTVASGEIASRARQSARRWRRSLKGDLDTIVLKALARTPQERYPGVDALRADLDRWLAGMPILARPESEWYRAGKFVSRHKASVGAVAMVFVSLVAGLSASLWQARVAQEEAAKARAVQGFLTDLFERNTRHQAGAAQARSRTVREVLVQAADRVTGAFAGQPAVKGELALTIARLLVDVDEFDRAASLFREAISAAKAAGLQSGDVHVEALSGLASVSRLLGAAREGLAARDEALAILDARGEGDTLLRARASASSVAQLSRDAAREQALAARAVAIYAERFPAHRERFAATLVLAQLHRAQGDWAIARDRFREAIALFEAVGARDFASLAAARAWAAFCAARLGLVAEALAGFESGLAALDEAAGPGALVTRFHRGHYASLLHEAGRHAEAHSVFDALARGATPGAPTVVDFDNAVYRAEAFLREGRAREAQALLDSFAAVHVEFGKRFYPNGVRWATLLALAHARQGRAGEARRALSRVEDLPRQYPLAAGELTEYRVDVARTYLALGLRDDAAKVLGTVPESALSSFSSDFVQLALAAGELALARGEREAAAARGREVLAHLRAHVAAGAFPDAEAGAARLVAGGRPARAARPRD